MEKRDTMLFQHGAGTNNQGWNIVELESRRQLRRTVHELIRTAHNRSTTTSEMQQQLLHGKTLFGNQLAMQLLRSLNPDNQEERQSIVWLLTLLNDKEIIPSLQQMSHNKRFPRSVRLSAALALAGMGATAELSEDYMHTRLYAIS